MMRAIVLIPIAILLIAGVGCRARGGDRAPSPESDPASEQPPSPETPPRSRQGNAKGAGLAALTTAELAQRVRDAAAWPPGSYTPEQRVEAARLYDARSPAPAERQAIEQELATRARAESKSPEGLLAVDLLGALRARDRLRRLLAETGSFKTHHVEFGPRLVAALAGCRVRDDVPALIEAFDREAPGAGGAVNAALERLTGARVTSAAVPESGPACRDAWLGWWWQDQERRGAK